MKHIIFFIALILFAFSACTSDNGTAPVNSGSVGKISGTVIDDSGNFIADVSVSTSPQTDNVKSDANGSFQIYKVPAGNYSVTASKSGYSTASADVKVAAGYPSKVQLILKKQTSDNRPPLKPFNPSPQNQTAITQTDITLSWDCSDPDSDAVTYTVYFGTDNPPSQIIAAASVSKQISVKNLQKGKPYYWRVIAVDSKGAVTEGDLWNFIITDGAENHPPVKPFNPYPKDKSVIMVRELYISWECSDPDGDAISYAVYFGTAVNPIYQIADNTPYTRAKVSALQIGKTYYWKVVATDSKGAVTESDVWQVMVTEDGTNHFPLKPSNPKPLNNSTITNTNVTLSWDCSDPDGNELIYDLYFATSNQILTLVSRNQSGRNFTLPTLALGDYYWKVFAKDSKGAITEGDVWHFTVAQKNSPPTKPSNPNPAVGAIVTKPDITMSWDCSDPDNDPLMYYFYIRSASGSWSSHLINGYKSFLKTGLSDRTKYYWKILAQDSHGDTTGSDIWEFTTQFESAGFMDKIIAYYKFNGDFSDASGNGYNGLNHSVTFATDRKGNTNSCGNFGAGNEYVEIPYPEAFNFKGDFTIACWVKPNLSICKDWDTHIDIIVKPDNTDKWLTFGFTRNLGLEYWTNQIYIGYDMTTLKDQQWNHIAVTFVKDANTNTGTAILYLNGVQLGTPKKMPAAVNNPNNLWIGSRPTFTASFGGSIDDMYFFNRTLTPAEIQQLAK